MDITPFRWGLERVAFNVLIMNSIQYSLRNFVEELKWNILLNLGLFLLQTDLKITESPGVLTEVEMSRLVMGSSKNMGMLKTST